MPASYFEKAPFYKLLELFVYSFSPIVDHELLEGKSIVYHLYTLQYLAKFLI